MSDGTAFQNLIGGNYSFDYAVTSIGVSVVGIFPQLQARTHAEKPAITPAGKALSVENGVFAEAVVDSESKSPVKNADVVGSYDWTKHCEYRHRRCHFGFRAFLREPTLHR